jgi:hypothetical protein
MIAKLLDYIKEQNFPLIIFLIILGIILSLMFTILYFVVCLFSYNIDFWITYYKGNFIHISKWLVLILYLLIVNIEVNNKQVGVWLFWLSIVLSHIMMVIVNG